MYAESEQFTVLYLILWILLYKTCKTSLFHSSPVSITTAILELVDCHYMDWVIILHDSKIHKFTNRINIDALFQSQIPHQSDWRSRDVKKLDASKMVPAQANAIVASKMKMNAIKM